MRINLSQYKTSLITAILNSPVEVFLSLFFFVIEMVAFFNKGYEIPYFNKLTYYYCSFFAIAFALNIIFKHKRIYYYMSILFPIIIFIYLNIGYDHFTSLIITTISSILLIFTAYNAIDNKKFSIKAIFTTLNIVISAVLTLVSALLIYSIIESLGVIFDIAINGNISSNMVKYTSLYIILPTIFLALNYKNSDEIKVDRFTEIMVNYILTPALLIYGVILYCYFAKILIIWELPKGIVSITAISFLTIGIIVKATRELTQKKLAEWFFKYISYISIPAIIMLWIGTVYRVWEYGFTENRIYLVITVVILTFWNFAQMWSKTNIYQYLTIVIIVSFNVALYIPTKHDTMKKEELKDNREIYSIRYFKNEENIDISGYNKLIKINKYSSGSNNYYRIKNDTLFFKTKSDSVFMWLTTKEIIDSILIDAGSNYSKLNQQLIDKIDAKPIIFKNKNLIMNIHNMEIEKKENKINLDNIEISQIITR